MTRRSPLFSLSVFVFIALPLLAAAPAVAAPLDPARYEYEPGTKLAADVGQQFLDDLGAQSPRVRAAVVDAVRYQIQAEESSKFVHQRKFVIAAYAVLFVILVGFVGATWLRSRRLQDELASLEERIKGARK